MKKVKIWIVNDKQCDGMPGKNSFFRTEKEASAYFTDKIWQKMFSRDCVEIEGEIYFTPKRVNFK